MPGIQQYQQTTQAGGTLNVSANASDFGAETANAVSNVGGALAQVGAQKNQLLREQEEKDARSWSGNAVSQATLDWTDSLQKRQESAAPGAPGFTPSVLADFDAYASKTIDSAPTKSAKDFVRQHMQSLRTSIGEKALHFEGQARVGQRLDNAESSIENAAKVVAQDPSQFNRMLSLVSETMPEVGPANASKLTDLARKQLVQAAATSNIQTAPDASYNAIYKSLHPMLSQPAEVGKDGSVAGSSPERGLRNNNPGNLRKTDTPWEGETLGGDPSFSSFKTPEAGIRALSRNLVAYQDKHGINTVEGIISRWAPATENDTDSYVTAVAKAVGVAPDAKLDMHDPKVLKAITTAIIKHENGKQPYQDGTIDAGVKSALGAPLPEANPDSVAAVAASGVAQLEKPDGEPVKTGVPWVDAMTVPERLHYLQQAATEQQRGISKLQTGLKAQERDLSAMVLSGVAPPPGSIPKESTYIAAYGQVDGPAHYRENVTDMVHLGEGIRSLQTASPVERAAMIRAETPEPGAGYDHKQKVQSALIKANEIIVKQLADDPAEYVLRTSPDVKAAGAAMQANPDSITTMAYVNAMNAEQQRLGVTSTDSPGKTIQQPRLLTTSQANAVIGQFYDQNKGGAKAADLIAGLEQQWGPAWPQVYGQLATDNKLPAAALVIPNMSDAGAKARLAAASVVKDEDFKKNMAPSDPKDIRETLLSQFDDARTTFAAQGVDGVGTLSKVMEQAEKLAMYYRVQGKSTKDAAKQAFTETMGWKYEFRDTYRVPKDQQPADVARGTSAYLDKLDKSNLQIMGAGFNMASGDQSRLTADVVSSNARWITNGDETGLRLMVQGRDGAMYQVKDRAGEPVNVQWKQFRDAATKQAEQRVEEIRTQAAGGGAPPRGPILQAAAEQDRQRRLRELGLR